MTNASHVTGAATARALAKAGAQVLVHDDRSIAKVESVVREIRLAEGVAKALAVDLATAQGAHQLARETREIVGERLDILVVNACVRETVRADATVETFDAQYALNTRAPFFLIQQLLPILSQGSSIIFTSPPASDVTKTLPAYLSTRDAVTHLVAHFASLLDPRGIRVNAIAVDAVATTALDVGAAIIFLASTEAMGITGRTLSARFTKQHGSRRGKPAARRTGVGSHG